VKELNLKLGSKIKLTGRAQVYEVTGNTSDIDVQILMPAMLEYF
jgi:hypothetical protein